MGRARDANTVLLQGELGKRCSWGLEGSGNKLNWVSPVAEEPAEVEQPAKDEEPVKRISRSKDVKYGVYNGNFCLFRQWKVMHALQEASTFFHLLIIQFPLEDRSLFRDSHHTFFITSKTPDMVSLGVYEPKERSEARVNVLDRAL